MAPFLWFAFSSHFVYLFLAHGQCDPMARLFIQNLAIYVNDSWLNGIKITNEGPTFCQIQNKITKYVQRLLKFCQSGEILPNLVTLLTAKHIFQLISVFCFPLISLFSFYSSSSIFIKEK